MGEEEKKAEEAVKIEEKKTKEPKKEEGGGEQVKKEEVKAAKVSDDKKKEDGESAKAATAPPPPPPPQEIVLRVFMHCEGCARKIRTCLKGFPGVEEVQTDCRSQKVVVKGAKADPVKVHERVQRKSHRKVELISPIPKPPAEAEEPKKVEDKQIPKPQDKKEEAQVIMVVLKVHMHCEACAQEIKKRILRMKGVESAEADLKGSQVTVKGVFEAPKLVEYVYKRTGKHAVIVKQESEKKDDCKVKDDKKSEEGGGEKDAKKDDKAADGGTGEGKEKKESGGQEAPKPEAAVAGGGGEQGETVMEMKKNEFYYYYPQNYQIYPPSFATDQMYSSSSNPYSYPAHAPQMFSDENPNACSVM